MSSMCRLGAAALFGVLIVMEWLPATVGAQSCYQVGQYIGASCSQHSYEWCIAVCIQDNCWLYAGGPSSCFTDCIWGAMPYCG